MTQTNDQVLSLKEYVRRSFRENIRQYTMLLALFVIWATFGFLTDGIFMTSRNLSNLFVQTGTTAILAIGMVLIIVAGHIDLSVGSVLGFCGAVAGVLLVNHGWGPVPTIIATLIVGTMIGAWHGYWVAYRRVPAFIVTLASMLAFRGAIIGVTEGQTLGLEMTLNSELAAAFAKVGQGYLPTIAQVEEGQIHDTSLYVAIAVMGLYVFFTLRRRLARERSGLSVMPFQLQILQIFLISGAIAGFFGIMVTYLGIPYCILVVLGLAVLFSFLAEKTIFGRRLYAIGGNPDAARFSGINIKRQTLYLFMLTGALVAIAGIIYTARLNAATTSAGQNAELDAIAAAVIGGTSLMGGEGTIIGAIIGGLVMTSLDNGMSLMNLDVTYQYVIKGLILLLAVWVDIATRKARE
jgi:D-xylose transport system permease protein